MRFRYAIAGAVVAALVILPASASAGQGGQVASVAQQHCAQQRADLGKRAFRKRYGPKHAMRKCVRRNRAKAASTLASAAQECQRELAENGADEFILDWAWDEDTVENAMSECVSDTLDELIDPSDSGDDGSDDEA